jgi:endonuclease III
MVDRDAVVRELLDRHGTTFGDELGLDLRKGTPSALFGLLLFAVLSSARIRSVNATAGTRALLDAGWSSVAKLGRTSWERRVRVLNQNGYARYDERTASMLGDLVEQVQDRWSGDLRNLRKAADGDVTQLRNHLTDLKGLGPVGADIFLREVQRCWPEVAPYLDKRAKGAAKALGLPTRAADLTALVDDDDVARLVAALVRTSLEKDAADVKAGAS